MSTDAPLVSRYAKRLRPVAPWLAAVAVLVAAGLLLVPQFTGASQQSQDATLNDCLGYLRAQIYVYASQHNNLPPGFPGNDLSQDPDAQTFVDQMTQYTDSGGRFSDRRTAACILGPYLMGVPANPLTLRKGILVTTRETMPAADESQPYGWIYNPRTRQIVANIAGTDAKGVAYASY